MRTEVGWEAERRGGNLLGPFSSVIFRSSARSPCASSKSVAFRVLSKTGTNETTQVLVNGKTKEACTPPPSSQPLGPGRVGPNNQRDFEGLSRLQQLGNEPGEYEVCATTPEKVFGLISSFLRKKIDNSTNMFCEHFSPRLMQIFRECTCKAGMFHTQEYILGIPRRDSGCPEPHVRDLGPV